MERPIFQPPGTPVEELDTPALVVDLDVMDRNIETVHGSFRDTSAKVRPHAGRHQCPQIARRQLQAGATMGVTMGGIAVTTVGEATVFAEAGFEDILVASPVVTRSKIARLCALAGSNRISVAVDDAANVAALSQAAAAGGVSIAVLVEMDLGLGRCGVAGGSEALELARVVEGAPGLRFQGLMAIPPDPGDAGEGPDKSEMEPQLKAQLQPVVDVKELLERAGVNVEVVSVGGTHNYDVAAKTNGVTEVQAGSYPLMDHHLCTRRPELEPAAKILASVISRPTGDSAVVDAGHKATGPDRGLAVLQGIEGAKATRFSAEHGVLTLEDEAAARLKPGDKTWLVPFNLSLCINQFDYIRAVRRGKLEGFWPIAGRGQFG